jgi:2-polyprenyl-6-methoxyphenol hydroxylase-like FAD-dependent oxidoreductase
LLLPLINGGLSTGQGLNTTLEDAYQLAAALKHSGSSIDLEAIQAFRVLQAQRLQPIIKFTTESGEGAYR